MTRPSRHRALCVALFSLAACLMAQGGPPGGQTPPSAHNPSNVQPLSNTQSEQFFELPPVDSSIPEGLYHDLFVVFVRTTLIKPDTPVWQRQDIHYTLNTVPISLSFVSDMLAMQISVAPQRRTKDSIIVMVSWQLWVKGKSGNVNYMTSANMYEIKIGERIIFYPFGNQKGQPLVMEILIDDYMKAKERGGLLVKNLLP